MASALDFEVDAGVGEWNVSAEDWLAANAAKLRARQLQLDGLATGAVVFNPEGKVLVLRRASHDSMPNSWEVPGGAVDAEDPTILHGAARELMEEAGLEATRFRRLATPGTQAGDDLDVFSNRNGTRRFCRYAFHVDVASCRQVRLDPAENEAFAWASGDDVRAQTMDGRPLPMTHESVRLLILEAFRTRRDLGW